MAEILVCYQIVNGTLYSSCAIAYIVGC